MDFWTTDMNIEVTMVARGKDGGRQGGVGETLDTHSYVFHPRLTDHHRLVPHPGHTTNCQEIWTQFSAMHSHIMLANEGDSVWLCWRPRREIMVEYPGEFLRMVSASCSSSLL